MSFTYTGAPQESPVDAVRFEMQDTEASRPLFQDEEITYALEQEAGPEPDQRGILSSAARLCEILERRFAAQADVAIGSLQATYSKQAKIYGERAVALRLRAQGYGPPFVGGQTKSEKRALAADRDRVQPIFKRRQFEVRRYGQGAVAGLIEENEGT